MTFLIASSRVLPITYALPLPTPGSPGCYVAVYTSPPGPTLPLSPGLWQSILSLQPCHLASLLFSLEFSSLCPPRNKIKQEMDPQNTAQKSFSSPSYSSWPQKWGNPEKIPCCYLPSGAALPGLCGTAGSRIQSWERAVPFPSITWHVRLSACPLLLPVSPLFLLGDWRVL